jgi:hypothetical protein
MRKRTPSRPVRCCAKRIGPGESIRMAAAQRRKAGTTNGSARRHRRKSSARLTYQWLVLVPGSVPSP